MHLDRHTLFRDRDAEDGSRVTPIELFFDLVFVFAVTQLSHRLLSHFTPGGALETLILFLAVWWLWMYTSWATNWLNPDRPLVRVLLMAMMLGGLILSTSIPQAFGAHGMTFVVAYVVLQIARTLFIVWAAHGHNEQRTKNFLRITCWFAMAAPLWLYGAWQDVWEMRLACWGAALAIEYAAPLLMFRVPGMGSSSLDDWDISGSHMAERCALFIIIALGEALLVTGATFGGVPHDSVIPGGTEAAFVACVVGSAAMWWIYFDTGASRGGKALDASDHAGRLARNGYTYLHMPIVAGTVLTAVGDQMVLGYPDGQSVLGFVLVACGGPMLFLAGNLAFKWLTSDTPLPPLSHVVGILLMLGIGVEGWRADLPPTTIAIASTAALIVTAAWEWFSLNGGWERWLPSRGERAAIALEESER